MYIFCTQSANNNNNNHTHFSLVKKGIRIYYVTRINTDNATKSQTTINTHTNKGIGVRSVNQQPFSLTSAKEVARKERQKEVRPFTPLPTRPLN